VSEKSAGKARVLVVGLERDLYDKVNPLLSRALFVVDRVPRGESGVLLARHATFELIVVRHPLPDMSLGSFMNSAREAGPCGASQLLVLTDEARVAEIRSLLPGDPKQVLSISEPWKLLQEVASRLLGVAPRIATRIMVRLNVQLAQDKSVVMCQSENISENGMLLRSDRLLPIGTRVAFDFSLPGDRMPVSGGAEVMRHAVMDVENVQGMGLRFVSVKGDGQRRLRTHLGRTNKP
jgi:uncharacterized protein (TIGR02266 family)